MAESNYQKEEMTEKLGCLWSKTSKKGVRFYSGVLNLDINGKQEKINIVVLHNHKELEKHPDYNIYLARPLVKEEPITNFDPTAQLDEFGLDDDQRDERFI